MRLAKWEITLLPLSLITTTEEAETILARNEGLLNNMLSEERRCRTTYYGCPHCRGMACRDCRWWVIEKYTPAKGAVCCRALFSGVAFNSVRGVAYGEDYESLTTSIYETKENVKAQRFLTAHVKWAKRMIDGTYKAYAKEHGIRKSVPRKGELAFDESRWVYKPC